MAGVFDFPRHPFPRLWDRPAPPLKGCWTWGMLPGCRDPGSGGFLPASLCWAQLCLLFVRNRGIRWAHHCQLGDWRLSLLEQELGQGCCLCHLPAPEPRPDHPRLSELLAVMVSVGDLFPSPVLGLSSDQADPVGSSTAGQSQLASRNLVLQTRIAGWEQGVSILILSRGSWVKNQGHLESQPKGMNEVAKGFHCV